MTVIKQLTMVGRRVTRGDYILSYIDSAGSMFKDTIDTDEVRKGCNSQRVTQYPNKECWETVMAYVRRM